MFTTPFQRSALETEDYLAWPNADKLRSEVTKFTGDHDASAVLSITCISSPLIARPDRQP